MSAARSTSSSTGLDSNLAGALAYVLGLISGLVFLAVERKDDFVRFHAMQSILMFLGVLVLEVVILSVPVLGRILNIAFIFVVIAIWILMMVKALSGQRHKLPYLGDLAERQLARPSSRF